MITVSQPFLFLIPSCQSNLFSFRSRILERGNVLVLAINYYLESFHQLTISTGGLRLGP